MSHSSSPAANWRRLIDQKRASFTDGNCIIPHNIDDERSFRQAIEALCRAHQDYNYNRVLVKLDYSAVCSFASAVDAIFDHVPPVTLAFLVCGGCYIALQRAYENGLHTLEVDEMLGVLNGCVPRLVQGASQYPDDRNIQDPLVAIFDAYLDCLILIINCLRPELIPIGLDPREHIRTSIQEAAATIAGRKAEVEQVLARLEHENTTSHSWSWMRRASNEYDASSRHSHVDFQYERELGRGSFGDVEKVREISTGIVYARKVIRLRNWSSTTAALLEQQVQSEYEIMDRLPHMHIVKVKLLQRMGDDLCIWMTPVADMNLRTYLESCEINDFSDALKAPALKWFGCLLDALTFAHQRKIVHRDIKPSNILIKDNRVFLADFGLAKDFTNHEVSKTSNANVHGTPLYRAPEVKPDRERGRAADIFSLGCVYSEMLSVLCDHTLEEYQKFRRNDSDEVPLAYRANLPKVQEWMHQLDKDYENDVLGTLVSLTRRMLKERPEDRPLAAKALRGLMDQPRCFCEEHPIVG